MSTPSISPAQDLVSFALRMLDRLQVARGDFDGATPAREEERGWLDSAVRRINEGVARTNKAFEDAVFLPELGAARKAKIERLLSAWVDALEQLLAGIAKNASAVAPIVEILFSHQNFAAIRRGGNHAQSFSQEFQRRAESAYVRRICTDPEYPFLRPILDAARMAHANWRDCATAAPLSEETAAALRQEILAAGDMLDLALRQARALSEAALAANPARLAELGLDAKPRRRAAVSE